MEIRGYISFIDFKNKNIIKEGDFFLNDILDVKSIKVDGYVFFYKMEGKNVKLNGDIQGSIIKGNNIVLEGVIDLKEIKGENIDIEGEVFGNIIEGNIINIRGNIHLKKHIQSKKMEMKLVGNNFINEISCNELSIFLRREKNGFNNIFDKKLKISNNEKILIKKITSENIILDNCYVDKIKCKNIILKNNCVINTLFYEDSCISEGENKVKNKMKGRNIL